MIKKLGYYLFAGFFFLFRLIPVQKNKVFMIQFDNFELISPLIYLNSDKIKDVSSYNDNYDEILKPIK